MHETSVQHKYMEENADEADPMANHDSNEAIYK